jgi:glyoxylase-like metal-dependent hydrolase (beta-lactamase superfamily II)
MVTESLAELVLFAPNVYGFRYQHHVAVFITTDEGVMLIDPIGQINLHAPYVIKEAIRSITDKPVRYVIYSHWGADHGMGGAAFADTARFVGHTNSVARIKATNDAASPLPDITFDKQTSLTLGGRTLDLYPTDLYDDDDYVILHEPASKVAMFVDLVQPRSIPFRDLLGRPERIVERLQWLHDTLDFDVLISGHDQPRMTCTKEDVREQRQYYLDLLDAVAAARAAGQADGSPEMHASIRATLEPRYGSWRRFDQFLDANIDGVIGWGAGTVMRTT